MDTANILDIDGTQWRIQDLQLTQRVAKLEETGTIINGQSQISIGAQEQYYYGIPIDIPKGTWLAIIHVDAVRLFSGYAMLGLATDAFSYPARNSTIINGYAGGFSQLSSILKSDGSNKARVSFYPYTDGNFNLTFTYVFVKLAD